MEPKFALVFSRKNMRFEVVPVEDFIDKNLRLLPATLDWALIGLYTSLTEAQNVISHIALLKNLEFSFEEGRWVQIS